MNIISEGLHRYSLDFQGLDQMHDLILLCCCSWKIIINVAAGPHQKDHKNMHMGGIILPQNALKVVKGSMLKAKPTFPKPWQVFLLFKRNQKVAENWGGKGK